jgi:hypothetical protein
LGAGAVVVVGAAGVVVGVADVVAGAGFEAALPPPPQPATAKAAAKLVNSARFMA